MDIGPIAVRLFIAVAVATGVQAQQQSPEFKMAQAKAHYQMALHYADQRLWAPAILELNRARQLEPGNPHILVELGIAHGQRQEWKQALTFLRNAVAVAPRSVETHYNLALTLDRADPGRGAGTPEYRKALQLNPRHVDSLINLGISIGEQNAVEAKALFERAIQLDPGNAIAHLNLGLLERESEESASIPEFREAIRLDPNLTEARRQLATLLVSRRQWDQVIEQCREILKRAPEDASARYVLGEALIRNKKVEEGRREIERSQALRQRHRQQQEAQELQNQGIRDMETGKLDDAAKAFASALHLDASASNHMYLGVAQVAAGDVKSGIRELTAALELEPANARAHLNLGSVYLQAGQEFLAKAEFDKALQIDPWFAEAHNNLGLMLAKNDQTHEAFEHFRLAVELNPEYPDAVFNLGLAFRAMNRLDDALKAFRRAVQLAPENAKVRYALGMTLKDKGDVTGAQAALEQAARLEGRNK